MDNFYIAKGFFYKRSLRLVTSYHRNMPQALYTTDYWYTTGGMAQPPIQGSN